MSYKQKYMGVNILFSAGKFGLVLVILSDCTYADIVFHC